MLGTLLALVLIVAMLLTVGGTIRSTVAGRGPAGFAVQRVRIAQTVRRETADLDQQYERLLRR